MVRNAVLASVSISFYGLLRRATFLEFNESMMKSQDMHFFVGNCPMGYERSSRLRHTVKLASMLFLHFVYKDYLSSGKFQMRYRHNDSYTCIVPTNTMSLKQEY